MHTWNGLIMKTNWVWRWGCDSRLYYGRQDGRTCTSNINYAALYPTDKYAMSQAPKLAERDFELIKITDKELFIMRLKNEN